MPGMYYWKNPVKANVGPDLLDSMDLLSSLNTAALALYEGDPMVITTVDGAVPRLRKVIQDDIDDLWTSDGTIKCGLLGIASCTAATDANGNFTTVPSVISVSGGVTPVYPILSMSEFAPHDLATGRGQMSVVSAKNIIGGNLWETTAVADALVGTMVGMLISTISGQPPTFFWSTAATTKIGRIVSIDDQNPLFNVTGTANVQDTTHYKRCPVGVRILSAYNQYDTAVNYDD